VTRDSLPPDIGRQLRSIRQRLFELERRRLPRASNLGGLYLFTVTASGGLPRTSGGGGTVFDWPFHLPFPARCVATATGFVSMDDSDTDSRAAGYWQAHVELSIDGDSDLHSGVWPGGALPSTPVLGVGDIPPFPIALQAERALASGTHAVSVFGGDILGATKDITLDVVLVGYPDSTVYEAGPGTEGGD
jgi:hypothetical protein